MLAVRVEPRRVRGCASGTWLGRLGAALALLWLAAAPARAAPAGEPPVTRFAPDIPVYPQTFDLAQDPSGTVYVAANDGVLVFNGARWKLLRLPNGDIARSLAGDGKGRIYVGGYDLFGYLERDANGEAQFHDLRPLYREALHGEHFADVWDVLVAPQGVYFMALSHLFEYRPADGQVRLWRNPGHYGCLFTYHGEAAVQFRGEGLRQLHGQDWEVMPGSQALSDLVYRFLPLPDGGVLTLARDGRWREYRDGAISDYPMPAGMPASSFINGGRALADGSLALAGEDGRLYLYDPASRGLRSFRIEGSALNGVIPALDGGLLTLSNLALFHVGWPSAWSAVRSDDGGLGGLLHGIASWDGHWLALTDSGVYQAETTAGPPARFRRLDWTDFEAWDLLPLDRDGGGGEALLAESYDLKLLRDGRATPLPGARVEPILLRRSKFDADLVYVGTENGLAVLHREGGRWQLKLNAADLPAGRVSSLVELARGELLAGSDRDGVQRIELAGDLSRIAAQRAYGAAEGIAYGQLASAVVMAVGQDALAATAAGIYRWNGSRFERTDLNGLEQLRQKDELLTVAAAPDGDLWAYSYARIYHRPNGGAWRREPLGGILRGSVENLVFDGRDTVLFAADSEMLRYDAGIVADPAAPQLRLGAVQRLDEQDRAQPLPLQSARIPVFPQEGLALRFELALPDYSSSGEARYQVQLEGYSQRPAVWSESRNYTYRKLSPGNYRFMAWARDSEGRISEIAPYNFIVLPPWYATRLGRALELLLLVLATVAVSTVMGRRRTRRLAAEKLQLENLVRQRTRELESANRRLDKLANLDGLTEIPNRRRLNDYLSEVWGHCSELNRPVSVLVIDIDHFKRYNDSHGHLAGDEVLKKLTQLLTACLRRAEDLVARFGGDEFVAVLPGAELRIAREVAEIMRRRVEEGGLGVTISVGYSSRVPQFNESVWALVHEVDGALYEAKRSGRNRVAAFGSVKA
jgi:diguanylate cyclase (GGDEF)-like protein